ncbi:WD repeat-containing protein 34 [Rhizophlyctis rosea]|uniref:WD repeat-containing protein 34 n=1 Tax=Rhizophlyctis rosea TaxID=64517 RepID=A0AAD5SL41_9FUNG|nr:WD repeat-containing protein 34 [Rhizophlyctis rosea]
MRDVNPESASFAAEVSSCLMCVACHPESPSLIAGGTYNGEVLIWQTSREEDPLVASSSIGDFTHNDCVTKVAWVPGEKAQQWKLVSVGSDGRVLFWDPSDLSNPKSGSQLFTGCIPRHIRLNPIKQDTPLGGTCFSFSKEHKEEYHLGTDSGYLFKCNTMSATQIDLMKGSNSKASRLNNPTVFAYNAHIGPVQSISSSPHHRNLFLTCGSDGLARCYSALQAKPVLTWEPCSHPLYAVEWSPHRSTVFAATCGDGSVYVYDLSHSRGAPFVVLQGGSKKAVPTTCLSFNQKSSEYLATGNAKGVIKIWRLSTHLGTEGGLRERKIIDTLGSVMDTEADEGVMVS